MKGVAVGELLYGVHAPRAAVRDFRDVWQSSDLILIVRLRNRNPALSFFRHFWIERTIKPFIARGYRLNQKIVSFFGRLCDTFVHPAQSLC